MDLMMTSPLFSRTGLALTGRRLCAAVMSSALLLSGCSAGYEDEVRPPSEQQLQDARTNIRPMTNTALREGIFHMQRVQVGSMVRVKDEIKLKKPDLPPFDVAYINRDLEEVLLELANAAGESVVIPEGLKGRTVTVVHSGASFQDMLDIVLSKAGYHYNYVNGVWYITRFPVRNYILEIGQSNRKGSMSSKAELSPELAEGTTANSGGSELDTDYTDQIWGQVRDTLGELVKVGAVTSGVNPLLNATGVTATGQLVTTPGGVTAVPMGATGVLPPPTVAGGTSADQQLFMANNANAAGTGVTVGINVTTSATDAYGQTTGNNSPGDDGMPWFKVTESAGLITVRASPEAHRQIEDYLEQVASSAQRQVIVEARIVALIRDKTTDRGTDVSANLSGMLNTALGRVGFYAENRLAAATASGGFLTYGSSADDLQLVVQSLSTLGDVYTVSSPSLLARNNQISRVSVTRQLGYAETQVDQNTTSTGDIVIGSRQDTARFKNAGTVMSVLPFIGKNRVQMRFRLSLANKAGDTTIKTAVGDETPVENLVPEMASNVIDQDMMLEFGRVYAIGGLVENNTNVQQTYEPNLRQIPGMSEIFQRANNNGRDTEFLVLLKVSRS